MKRFIVALLAAFVVSAKHHVHPAPEPKFDVVKFEACAEKTQAEFGHCLLNDKTVDACITKFGNGYARCKMVAKGMVGGVGQCEANCGISAGQCMIRTFDPVQCGKEEGICALECLKQ